MKKLGTLLAVALFVTIGCLSEDTDNYKLIASNENNREYEEPIVFSSSSEPVEDSEELCGDEIDNDLDGDTDCDDSECKLLVICQESSSSAIPPKLPENTALKCSNGLDDDENGLADCEDPQCQDFIVCLSSSAPIIPPEDTHALCTDGEDNDNDGQTDCDDIGCQLNVLACQNPPISSSSAPQENSEALCSDDIDNDDDGDVDCDDSNCSLLHYCQQTSVPEEPSGQALEMPDKIVRIPDEFVEFEDFVEPGLALKNGWKFSEGDGYRQDKAKYNTTQNSNVYGLIVDYPDEVANDTTGVEFNACLCHLEYRFEDDGGYNDGSKRGCYTSKNFPNGQEVTSSVFGGETGPWNVCLTFLHAAEVYSYVIEVPEKGDYNMYISANTANHTDPAGETWGADSDGFEITLDFKDLQMSESYVNFKENIVVPHTFPGDGAQWIKIRELEPQKITFPDHMPNRILMIFESDGRPYNIDYVRFEKL